MSFVEKNLEIIKRKDIVLYEQLQQDKLIDRVMSETAKDGNTYLKVQQQGKWVAFNSTYKPLEEAKRFASKYKDLPLFGRVLFLGFGNGYVARACMHLFENDENLGEDVINADRRFAFYEPDMAIFMYVLQTYDLTDILENNHISIFVEGLNSNLLQAWCADNVGTHNESSFYLDALPKYKDYYQDAYTRMESIHANMIMSLECYRETKNKLAKHISRNNIYNLKFFEQSMNLKWFVENYPKNLPFVIVAAGPSLKDRVEFLKQIQGKAFIMAVDTAVKYLLEQGITPDGVLCIDSRKRLTLFQKEMLDIPFFVHADVNRLVLDKVCPKYVYFLSAQTKYYEQRAMNRDDYLLDLDSGGSVATMAFSFAAALQVSDVILVGQDLSIQGNTTHVVDDMIMNIELCKHFYVPGNEEEQVTTLKDFYLYIQWFQQEIARHPEIHVWNVTAGGAKITGARYVQPEELFTELPLDSVIGEQFRVAWNEQKSQQKQAFAPYEDVIEKIQNIIALLEEGKNIAKVLHDLCETRQVDTKEFAELNAIFGRVEACLSEVPEFELLEQYCASMEDELLHNLYEEKDDKILEMQQIYGKLYAYYECLSREAEDLITICKDAMK